MSDPSIAELREWSIRPSHFERVKAVQFIATLPVPGPEHFSVLKSLMRDDTIAVRLAVASTLKQLGPRAEHFKTEIENRMEELRPAIYFLDPHFQDTTTEEGMEFYALQAVLEAIAGGP